jgi:hypothetical protein
MTVYHKHHIVPKHDLVTLTIQEHAEAHRILFEQYNRWQDRIAWLTLSGQIDSAEAARLSRIESNKTRVYSEKTKKKISESNKGKRKSVATEFKSGMRNSPNTEFKKGNTNHNAGKIWINDGKNNIAIELNSVIPEGWSLGMIKESNPQKGWNAGMSWSDSVKKNISQSRKGKGTGSSNAMANEENRKKVAASKIGRKRIYREDGSYYMSQRTA